MKNIRKFNTTAEMESAVLTEPYVLYNEETGMAYTNPNGGSNDNEVDYSGEYLTFEAIEDSRFKLTQNTCQYSLDEGNTWTSLSKGTYTPTVSAGNKIMFKKANPSISYAIGIGTFSSTGKFNISGNIMSILYGDDFIDKTSLTGKYYAFSYLFNGCSNVVDTSNLILPATTLIDECYTNMFRDCSSLTTTPKLPATTLATKCYGYMFKGCTSLVNAPELPATTMREYCYNGIFSGCTSLITAPALPATKLVESCYSYMFCDCTSLVTAPELPATNLAKYCYCDMFNGCNKLNNITMLATNISATDCLINWVSGVSSTGTFVKHPDMTTLPTGVDGIPEGWTVEDAVL